MSTEQPLPKLIANKSVRSVKRMIEVKGEMIPRISWTIWDGSKWCRTSFIKLPTWVTRSYEHTKHQSVSNDEDIVIYSKK